MLQKRGNAIDALVSIIICLSVKRPDVISMSLLIFTGTAIPRRLFDGRIL